MISALRESFKRVLTSNFQRHKADIEEGICDVAVGAPLIQTDRMAPYLDRAITVWNSHADAIDRKFGKGWFNVRLMRENAFTFRFMTLERPKLRIFVPLRKAKSSIAWWAPAAVRLDYLMATEPEPGVYQWMSDVLHWASIPDREQQLLFQAKATDGFWNRRLRKRKWAIAQKQAAATREADIDLKQDQQWQKTRTERLDIMARHKELERLLRQAGDKDIDVGWPHGWRKNPLDPGGTGMFVPLSPRQAQNTDKNPRTAPKGNPDNRRDPKVALDLRNTMRQVGGLDKK
jgi:hypothetical protein